MNYPMSNYKAGQRLELKSVYTADQAYVSLSLISLLVLKQSEEVKGSQIPSRMKAHHPVTHLPKSPGTHVHLDALLRDAVQATGSGAVTRCLSPSVTMSHPETTEEHYCVFSLFKKYTVLYCQS